MIRLSHPIEGRRDALSLSSGAARRWADSRDPPRIDLPEGISQSESPTPAPSRGVARDARAREELRTCPGTVRGASVGTSSPPRLEDHARALGAAVEFLVLHRGGALDGEAEVALRRPADGPLAALRELEAQRLAARVAIRPRQPLASDTHTSEGGRS